jgi:hypothetical protein
VPSKDGETYLDSEAVYHQAIEVFSRAGDVWVYRAYGPEEVVRLASIDLTLSMDVIYEDIEFGPRGC